MEGQLTTDREAQARADCADGIIRAGAAPPRQDHDPAGILTHSGGVVGRDVIRLALYKITRSPEFAASIQLRQFLTFVVEASIADPPVPLKGYTIATQALGRDDSFNPAADPIVRVEAARLRKRLEDYYAGTGQNDPVRIIIPKGSYQPGFHLFAATAREDDMPDGEAHTPSGLMTQSAGQRVSVPAPGRQFPLTATQAESTGKPAFPAFLLHPAVFFPLMALAFAAGYAAARL